MIVRRCGRCKVAGHYAQDCPTAGQDHENILFLARLCGPLLGKALLDVSGVVSGQSLAQVRWCLERFTGSDAYAVHRVLQGSRLQVHAALESLLEGAERASTFWHVLCSISVLVDDYSGRHENDLGLALNALSEQADALAAGSR